MATFVIFWSSLIALLFFVLGTVFKGLAAVVVSLFQTIAKMTVIAFYTGVALGILYLVKLLAYHVSYSNLEDVFSSFICTFVGIVFIVMICGWLGALILGFIANIGIAIMAVVGNVANGGATICEKGFVHFLKAIIKRVEKC